MMKRYEIKNAIAVGVIAAEITIAKKEKPSPSYRLAVTVKKILNELLRAGLEVDNS